MWIYQNQCPSQNTATSQSSALPKTLSAVQPMIDRTDISVGSSPDSVPPSREAAWLVLHKPLYKARRSGQATRSCLFLAGAYLFGTLLAGIFRAAVQSGELELMEQYIENWSQMFVLSEPEAVLKLFLGQYLSVVGTITALLALGLCAFGPVLIYLFTMLYGLGIGMMGLQLFLQMNWKNFAFYFLLAGLPAAAVAVCLCIFGALALEVSTRLQKTVFGRCASAQPVEVKGLLGEYLMFDLILLPICGIATALAYLANQISL